MKPIKDLQLRLLATQLVGSGYPEPEPEYQFARPRRWRFDLAWPELMLAFEKEGGVYARGRHTRGKGFEDDIEKYNAAELAGWTLIRASTGQISSGLAYNWLSKALDRAPCGKAG